ncbi:TetR/AcrR family transcriptional regulator [Paractinoplanes lichenicola]|uniref:TetR/AcrR family transcriptional regulator n=1 Tax=Paractinoplanes lichenicola TaxID=2802976 RepID=A0ABS1VKW6_9ACTN|nr:TetR/AcrR family transcriptional regulator [Actinoplanes lichenicola]MBL7255370.1 TetR/AcrR family transcriptional regulator [Actinoplanes lichenicola]
MRADNRRTDTRDRVLAVALELFAQQGYQVTSLREIADRLGVTKAAVYFHFRTKQEILTALLRGYADVVVALVADAERGRPLTAADEEALLRRYAAFQQQWGFGFVLLVRQNYAEVRDLPIGAEVRERTAELVRALAPAGAGPKELLRVRMALTTFQVAASTEDPVAFEAAVAVALEILRSGRDMDHSASQP